MDDRREFERREAAVQAEVCHAGTGEVVGLLADVSAGGMMLRTGRAHRRGERLRLSIELPGPHGEQERLLVEAEVRWSEPDLVPGEHQVGLAFAGPTPPSSAAIEGIRRRLGQRR